MADTGERHQNTQLANAKEAETVHEAKNLASKAKQRAEKAALQDRFRGKRNEHVSSEAKPIENPIETEAQRAEREASVRMVDEGDPNKKP